jgi:hypothetical protein
MNQAGCPGPRDPRNFRTQATILTRCGQDAMGQMGAVEGCCPVADANIRAG